MAKVVRFVSYLAVFLAFLAAALLWLMPLTVVNSTFLPKHFQLLAPSGNVHTGRWHDVKVNGRQYPLTCAYQRTDIGFSGLAYQISCDTPLTVEAKVAVSFSGSAHLTDVSVAGDMGDTAAWQAYLGVPVKISGPIAIDITRATVEQQRLSYLDVAGKVEHIKAMGMPLMENIVIETLNKALSDSQPIVVETRTAERQTGGQPVSTGQMQLYLTSEIDGKNYVTRGEVSGEAVKNAAGFLRFFGRQTSNDRLAVQMQGSLFP